MGEESFKLCLERAAGYFELGMWQAAWDALEALPAELRADPHVLALRVCLFLEMGKSDEARLVATTLTKHLPEDGMSWLSMARVEACAGQIREARAHLETAFEIAPHLRLIALDDTLLEAVWVACSGLAATRCR